MSLFLPNERETDSILQHNGQRKMRFKKSNTKHMAFNINYKFIEASNAFNIFMLLFFYEIEFSRERKTIASFDMTSKYNFTLVKREI